MYVYERENGGAGGIMIDEQGDNKTIRAQHLTMTNRSSAGVFPEQCVYKKTRIFWGLIWPIFLSYALIPSRWEPFGKLKDLLVYLLWVKFCSAVAWEILLEYIPAHVVVFGVFMFNTFSLFLAFLTRNYTTWGNNPVYFSFESEVAFSLEHDWRCFFK